MRLDLQFQQTNSRLAFMAWRDQVHGFFNGLQTLSQADAKPFSAHTVLDQAPGLRLGDITAAPQIVVRSAALSAPERADKLGLLIQLQGTACSNGRAKPSWAKSRASACACVSRYARA